MKAWCAEHGISPKTYYNWEKQIVREATQRYALGTPVQSSLLVQVNPDAMPGNDTGVAWSTITILSKTAYAFTTGTVGAAVRTWLYEYNDSNWKDKLTKFDGYTITYDAIGNPLNDGEWSYVWEAGRQLKRITNLTTGVVMEFSYNHAGLRTKKVKKVNGTVTETTEYILNGKNVVGLIHTNHVTSVTNRLHFFYDTQDKQAMVEFNGTKYNYVYNLQGDIIGILAGNGELVVEYRYDAWGNRLAWPGA